MTDHAAALPRSRRSGTARLWRGWVTAVLAVLLAAGGHQAAHSITHGATAPIPWELLAFSAALTAPLAVALTAKRIAAWSTGLTTVFAQLAFHLLYSLPYTGSSALPNGHHHHVASAPAPTEHITHAVETTAVTDTTMLFAHVVAAALTTWSILYGERSLVALTAWLLLVPVKLLLEARPASTARPARLLPLGLGWIPHARNIAQTQWTRGPPVLA